MRRRGLTVLLLVGVLYLASPIVAAAQQRIMPVIGFLGLTSPDLYAPFVAAFRKGLEAAGFVEGRNVAIEFRWAEGHYDRVPALAADLVRARISVMVTSGGVSVVEPARAATASIPIVATFGGDPVRYGVAASLNRPGGNVTGVSLFGAVLGAKRVGIMHELIPAAHTIGLLFDARNPDAEPDENDIDQGVRTLGQTLTVMRVGKDLDLETAVAAFAKQHTDALVIGSSSFFLSRCAEIVALAARYSLPTMYADRTCPAAGGLISYGASLAGVYRQLGGYAGRVLAGANPAEMPIEQPTTFGLVINLKTAMSLGIAIPPTLLARADEVIE